MPDWWFCMTKACLYMLHELHNNCVSAAAAGNSQSSLTAVCSRWWRATVWHAGAALDQLGSYMLHVVHSNCLTDGAVPWGALQLRDCGCCLTGAIRLCSVVGTAWRQRDMPSSYKALPPISSLCTWWPNYHVSGRNVDVYCKLYLLCSMKLSLVTGTVTENHVYYSLVGTSIYYMHVSCMINLK